MGARGPRPKPTAVKKREGNAGKRPLNDKEPEFEAPPDVPPAPEYLNEAARAEWDRVAPELFSQGLLKKADYAALAGYCQCFARWVEAEKFIEENGSVIVMRDDDGDIKYVQQAPQVGISNRMLEHMRKFAAEFGMTPSARSRVQTDKPKDDTGDPWAALGLGTGTAGAPFGVIDGGKSGKKKK